MRMILTHTHRLEDLGMCDFLWNENEVNGSLDH